jgi:type IX secretion system PorP/SprF family membrane protein
MSIRKTITLLILVVAGSHGIAQDPHFSQFFMAPHFINPANVGTQQGEWSVMGNARHQWGNAGTLFLTQAMAGEVKLTGREDFENTLAVGMSLMNDQSMNGAFRSNYASGTVAYHLQLNDNHRIALGMQAAFGNRRLDQTRLVFGEQFSGAGFDVALPSGEPGLQSMRPFMSVGTGLLYTYARSQVNVDAGLAVYDLNRPRQTFLGDPNQYLRPRTVGSLNIQYMTRNRHVLNFHGIQHIQTVQGYFAVGGSVGIPVSADILNRMFFAGAWFREGDAILPYTGIRMGNVRIGLSYDVTLSKQNKGPVNPRSFEISMIYTRSRQPNTIMDCRVPKYYQIL